MKISMLLLLTISLLWQQGGKALDSQDVVAVGDEVCVEGFIMDYFCIELGTLLDNPSVVTLEGPDQHSVHCLVDIQSCLATPYEVLNYPSPGEIRYSRGWRLDDETKQQIIELARQNGSCGTCDDGYNDQGIQRGFHAGMKATVVELGSGDIPPVISASQIQISSPQDRFCSVPVVSEVPLKDGQGTLKIETSTLDNSVTMELAVEAQGWVGLGVGPGTMINSTACIGLPDAGTDPELYSMTEESPAGVMPADASQQILVSSSIVQNMTHTVLTCVAPLDADADFSVSSTEENLFVYAWGSSNTLGYHAQRDNITLTLTGTPPPFPSPAPGEPPAPTKPPAAGVVNLSPDLILRTETNSDITEATFTLEYEGEAWLGLGVSDGLVMVPRQAVIGLPDSGVDPVIYNLAERRIEGVTTAPVDEQILLSSSITQENGGTVLVFTAPLDQEGDFFISSTEPNVFIYAVGRSNELGLHAVRNQVELLTLEGKARVGAEPNQAKYTSHGVFMSVAWGILVPLAIGASMLRDLLPGPPGTFFILHRAINGSAVIFTIIGFSLAVNATSEESLEHFSTAHRKAGLAIFILAVLQAFGGIFRPHLPHKPEEDKINKDTNVAEVEEGVKLGDAAAEVEDEPRQTGEEPTASRRRPSDGLMSQEEVANAAKSKQQPAPMKTEQTDEEPTASKPPAEEKKSIARRLWEVGHRCVGFALLGLSWYNCSTGIEAYETRFGEASFNWSAVFWGISAGIFGFIFVVYIGNKAVKMRKRV